ncbi:MAG: TlyA family rRNA (cytidine-2'-O)-methyltransferase [Actinobacteria bacterium]|nr:MAG: TlyA family rRNA (cytidine-2'-O)-methyltransferase [Actinomycetota bacterium]
MSKKHRARFVALASLVAARCPTLRVEQALVTGRVLVDGRVLTNPAARVRADASIKVLPERRLRGETKLTHALSTFDVQLIGRVAIDLGASAGGFTSALLAAGARRVYAIDAGVGQLVGRLRLDPRVVNLEGHNLGAITTTDVPHPVDVVTMDLSYLPIAMAAAQLDRFRFAEVADLISLVKPTFELHRGELACLREEVEEAVGTANTALRGQRWCILGTTPAPRTGRRGAPEVFLHARRHRVL